MCVEVENADKIEEVSLRDIEKIIESNGSFVKMKGVLHYSFEDVALYPTMNADPKYAVWLDLKIPDHISDIEREQLHGLSITAIGKVNKAKKGHFGMYIASLDNAVYIEIAR